MLRASPATSMQKTYDECYLICSTAVYFEKQNNEEEALKSWRSALDQIYYHNAYKIPASYRPKTETEKALQESLHDMELQCKERVDLLDALKKSRMEASKPNELLPPTNGSRNNSFSSMNHAIESTQNGPGDGTVPPVNYHDLARPVTRQAPSPKPLSRRPGYVSNRSTQNDIERSRSAPQPQASVTPLASNTKNPSISGPTLSAETRRTSRTPSPKGKIMKTTLRASGKEGTRASSSKMPSTMRNRGPDAAKAATLAWAPPPQAAPGPSGLSTSHTNGSTPSVNSYSRKTSLDDPSGASDVYRTSNDSLRPPSPSEYPPPRPNPYGQGQRPPSYQDYQRDVWQTDLTDVSDNGVQNHWEPPHRPPPTLPPRFHGKPILQNEAPPPPAHAPPITAPPPASSVPAAPVPEFPSYRKEYGTPAPLPAKDMAIRARPPKTSNEDNSSKEPSKPSATQQRKPLPVVPRKGPSLAQSSGPSPQTNTDGRKPKREAVPIGVEATPASSKPKENATTDDVDDDESAKSEWDTRVAYLLKHLPRGVDEAAAKAIFNEIVVKGDEVHWDDVAGLDIAKTALKEAVVYPFLRPDLFLGLREPARGMLLFGPPGTGKTMLARAVATESKSTFFAISASSLTSKYLGESEKLVRALFSLAKVLAPSIIFVDEIDSLLSSRGGGAGEHEATRRIKTEFLIQWSDLAKAAAGREQSEKEKAQGDATRVLVLAATNLPWAIDEAARRRFVRRQYIPLPESDVREDQLRRLISAQKHNLVDRQIKRLVALTDGFSGSDITALAKDAAMGPLRSLGEDLLRMTPDEIRPISYADFEASLVNIRPSVSKQGLREYEEWARDFGERGG